MTPQAERRVICTWCRADVTPIEGLTDLDMVHCLRCGCTFVTGLALGGYQRRVLAPLA